MCCLLKSYHSPLYPHKISPVPVNLWSHFPRNFATLFVLLVIIIPHHPIIPPRWTLHGLTMIPPHFPTKLTSLFSSRPHYPIYYHILSHLYVMLLFIPLLSHYSLILSQYYLLISRKVWPRASSHDHDQAQATRNANVQRLRPSWSAAVEGNRLELGTPYFFYGKKYGFL